ncbi:MAG: V-type ATP synthase subunit F [Candidatus Geothermincolia bacterium]
MALVGTASSILGFRSLGVDAFEVARPQEAGDVWRSIDVDRYAVIFVTEDVAVLLSEELGAFVRRPLPVITLIPPITGGKGTGVQSLRALVELAVGADILKD